MHICTCSSGRFLKDFGGNALPVHPPNIPAQKAPFFAGHPITLKVLCFLMALLVKGQASKEKQRVFKVACSLVLMWQVTKQNMERGKSAKTAEARSMTTKPMMQLS